MKHILTLCLFILLTLSANGQSQNVDSLVNVLETKKLTVEEQLDLYDKIAKFYSQNDAVKSMFYGREGLRIAEKEKDKKMIARSCLNIGAALLLTNSLDSSWIFLNRAVELSEEVKDRETEARAFSVIGIWYNWQYKKEEALEYNLKSLALYESIGDKANAVRVMINTGSLYGEMHQNERVFHYIQMAQATLEKMDGENLNLKMGLYELSGGHYIRTGDYEKALENMLIALDLSRKNKFIRYEISTTQYLATIYAVGFHDYANAEKYALECVKAAESTENEQFLIAAWNILANVYVNAGKFKEGKDIALKVWSIDSTSVYAVNTASTLATCYVYADDKEKALYYFGKHDTLRVRASEEHFQTSMADVEVKYETEKKEMRIASLEKEQRLYVWLGIAGVLLAFSLATVQWLKTRNSKKERLLVASKAVQDGEMGERERIASELHDRLLGTLSAVKSELGDTDVGNKLNGCIEEIRRISRNLMPLPLRFGIKTALEDFTAQFPNVHFHFFGQEKRIEKRLEFVVYCCVNELVTNAIRYSGAKKINVQMVQGEDHISLTVQDDGCGFDEKTIVKGVGLKSVRDRLTSCNGKMGIFSSPNKGTEIIIEINI